MDDSVLVACPTARVKDYCLDRYLAAYRSFSHRNKHLLMVDASPETEGDSYRKRLHSLGVEMVDRYPFNINNLPTLVTKVCEEIIIPKAWEMRVDWILHLESDVICPPEMIDLLLDTAHWYEAEIVGHSYKARGQNEMFLELSVGCIMWKRTLFRPGHNFMDYMENYIRHQAYERGAKGVQLTRVLETQHLSE